MKTTTRKSSSQKSYDELPVRDPGHRGKKDIHRSYVFYGRSGTGKTTISSTFPKPILLIDANDRGDDSVSDVKDLKVFDAVEWEDIEQAYWHRKKNPGKYKTVVLDTVTMIQGLAMEFVMASKSKKNEALGNWGTMTKQEWGKVAQLMKTWIVNFRDLPMEVVFIAQDRTFNFDGEESDQEENVLTPEVGPRLMPSVASGLNAAVHVIGNTFTRIEYYKKEVNGKKKEFKRTDYCLRIGPNPVYITKVRKPKSIEAPSYIVDPTYDDIIDTIEGA